jgi:hypothetical protein
MKHVFFLLMMSVVTFSMAAGQKGKNNAKPANIVNSQSIPPATQAPAKVKKDFTNWLAKWAKDTTKAKMQFYGGDTIFLVLGESAFEPVVDVDGNLTVVDRRIFFAPNVMGTFSKMEGKKVLVTFAVAEKGKVPGDTIDVPFLPNGDAENTSYVLKSSASTGGLVGSTQTTAETFSFNGNKFTINKGAYSVPLKVVIGTEKNYVKTEDKKVNAVVTTVTSSQGLDPFIAPK